MNTITILTGMICKTVIALTLIGSRLPDDESEEDDETENNFY